MSATWRTTMGPSMLRWAMENCGVASMNLRSLKTRGSENAATVRAASSAQTKPVDGAHGRAVPVAATAAAATAAAEVAV